MRSAILTGVLYLATASAGYAESAIPDTERVALAAIWSATGGPHWKNASGWMGDPGTECDWCGVTCDIDQVSINHVTRLQLEGNDLRGAIPQEVVQLTDLRAAWLWDNSLTAVPTAWLDKEDRGQLDLRLWNNPLHHRITEISIEVANGSLLCSHSMLTLAEDGSVTFAAIRCRNRNDNDRATYCELKKGRHYLEFRRLARFIEKSGFFELKRQYTVNQTHAGTKTVRLRRDGQEYVVDDYGYAEPIELFGIEQAIAGVASDFDWQTTSRHPESFCRGLFEHGQESIYTGLTFLVQMPPAVEAKHSTHASSSDTPIDTYTFSDAAGVLLVADEGLQSVPQNDESLAKIQIGRREGLEYTTRGTNALISRRVFFRVPGVDGNPSYVSLRYDKLPTFRAAIADRMIESFDEFSRR